MIFAVVGQLLLGWLLADLLTGVFHWWEDTNPQLVTAPVIGQFIIAPNILHHAEPLAFTTNGFWGRNNASIIAAVLIGIGWTWLIGPSAFMFALLVGGALSNEVHHLAHSPSSGNAATRVLQQIGVIQSPKHHALHHRPPHDHNYCILTDWLNPIAEALR